MRRFARALLLTTIALICSAHIGSPDAWYNGPAGPYHVLVHVRAPAVVPGIAVINIKPDEPVDSVTAFVNKYDAIAGGPPPDVAKPNADAPGWYRTQLWVMDPGSNSVTVSVRGSLGAGTAVIPLVAVAARRLEFNGLLTVVLGAAGLVLVAGLLTLVGAAVRESVLVPGTSADEARKKRARFAMLRGAIVIVVVISGLGVWWRAEDALFAQNMFKPLTASARIERANGLNQLVFTITDSVWVHRNRTQRMRVRGGSEFTTLVADHDKLMHMFLIAENGSAAFAHLHPTTTDSVSFTAAIPPLPAGRYRVFADVLHESGFAQTLTANITLDAPSANTASNAQPSDADDAWLIGNPASNTSSSALADGSSLTWLDAGAPHVAGEEARLRFQVTPPVGDTTRLEPYLGMLGHAAVVRDDGAVFIHLHPMGTISVAAQSLLSHGSQTMSDMPAMHGSAGAAISSGEMSGDTLQFPYAFPTAGKYTVWVQVKRHGRVLTGAFRVIVAEGAKQ